MDHFLIDGGGWPILFVLRNRQAVPAQDKGEWSQEMTGPRHVSRSGAVLKDGTRIIVSTVFLGVAFDYRGSDPLLFETMIFGGEFDQRCTRYTTWEEAENGHLEIVARLVDLLGGAPVFLPEPVPALLEGGGDA